MKCINCRREVHEIGFCSKSCEKEFDKIGRQYKKLNNQKKKIGKLTITI